MVGPLDQDHTRYTYSLHFIGGGKDEHGRRASYMPPEWVFQRHFFRRFKVCQHGHWTAKD